MNYEELMSILGEERAKLKELSERVEQQQSAVSKLQTNYEDVTERFLLALKVLNQMHESMVPLLKVVEEYKNHIDPEENEWTAKNFNHRKKLMVSQAQEALRYFDYFKDSAWGKQTYIG